MKLTPYQSDVINAKICPYCKSGTKLMSEHQVYGKTYKNRVIHACKNYPTCDAYVGSHDNGIALGRLANHSLRIAKKKAHHYFDKIWKEELMDRSELYAELAEHLDLPEEYTHIGMFSEKTCRQVENWSRDKYNELKIPC